MQRSRRIGSDVLSAEQWARLARSLELSERQCEIVQAIFDDDAEASIALRLGISTHTVHSYMHRLHEKVGVPSRVGLVVSVMAEHVRLLTADANSAAPECSGGVREL